MEIVQPNCRSVKLHKNEVFIKVIFPLFKLYVGIEFSFASRTKSITTLSS